MIKIFHHIFFLKKPKCYEAGPVPIYLRITISGKRSEISINKKIEPTNWMPNAGRMKGSIQLVRKFNAYLVLLEGKLYDAYQILVREKEVITSATLKNKYTGASDRERMLIAIFQKHNDEFESLVPKQFSKGTLERYKTSMSHTVEFMKWKYKVSDIDVRDINHEFVTGYDYFLRSVRNCANNTAVKYLKNFKKITRICMANGWLDKDPFLNYRGKLKEIATVFLCEDELKKIRQKEFSIGRLNQVKDIFVFCCLTGLAYSDVKKMSYQNISTDNEENKWLMIKRTKTGTGAMIPLLPAALEILDKYEQNCFCLSQNKLLPVLSNQKTNGYLKEIADICGIQKKLTFHTARHTFATTVTLNNNVPIESVSKMLGHKTIYATQHYAKIMDKKISHDMLLLVSKFKENFANG